MAYKNVSLRRITAVVVSVNNQINKNL